MLILTACGEDPITPVRHRLTVEEQLSIFFNDSGKVVNRHTSGEYSFYSEELMAVGPDIASVNAGDVVFFHYGIDTLSVLIDSLSLDTAIFVGNFIPLDLNRRPSIGLAGADAIYPVGLDEALITSGIQVGESFNYYLPPEMAYGEVPIPGLPLNKIIRMRIRLDSIVSEFDMYNQARLDINQYILEAELRDTSVVRGGPVIEIYNFLIFKSLDPDTTTRPRPIPGDSVRININDYWYATDSIKDGGLKALLQTTQFATLPFSFLVGDELTLPALSEGIQWFRDFDTKSERGLLIIHTASAYRESVCLVPDLRSGYWSRTNGTIDYLIANYILPEYAFQVEPYQSLVMVITLRDIY